MQDVLFHARRLLYSHAIGGLMRLRARSLSREPARSAAPAAPLGDPQEPEDFRPLENSCFQNPYGFYKVLRDRYPVYRLSNGIYCISRYDDICAVSRDTDTFSSTHQGAVAGLRPGQDIAAVGARHERLAYLGLIPADVLALSDPPRHTDQRKVGHRALSSRYVDSLEGEIEAMVREMMNAFIDRGEIDFMTEFGWKLPMKLIIRLLGFPERDFERIKAWCVAGISTQSGIASPRELMLARVSGLAFIRYCWKQFLIAKKRPRDDLSAVFVNAATDPGNPMTDVLAVSAIFQLLIAGSDSSATSMGNALKMLIENPGLEQAIRDDPGKLPAFIEEVFRLESAFQGHFRWVKKDTELHGVELPRGSRVFLMWASGNRDERVFENPDSIDLERPNGKKHLTFGHGIHACIGRELARSEIRIVLRELLSRTSKLRFDGEHPFIASMFARTLLTLPIRFERAETRPATGDSAG